ncbi:hypothetical protein [Streptomyces sp. NPDC058157]|uniref:hypothetical protein n=1 Tax=Streptomyces sp. NPDC058157 TaxID=3346360 RepID=UPI0036E7D6E7
MHRRSKALYGLLATALGMTLTACGGAGGDAKSGATGAGAAKGGAAQGSSAQGGAGPESPAAPSASKKPGWGPALPLGRPAPALYEPGVTGGGKFEITVSKIVKGTAKQAKALYWDRSVPGEVTGDTPYFVFLTYTLKEGKPAYSNADLGAGAQALDENGVQVAKRPEIHTGFVEGGCPSDTPIYMGWDVGETHTFCTVFAGYESKPPTRLFLSAGSEGDFTKGTSWAWPAQ